MDHSVKIEMQCSTCSRARRGYKCYTQPILCNFDDKPKCDDDLCIHWKLSEAERQHQLAKKIGYSKYTRLLWGLEPEK